MADRSNTVQITADVTGIVSAMSAATTAVSNLATSLDNMSKYNETFSTLATQVGGLSSTLSGAAGYAASAFTNLATAVSTVKASANDATSSVDGFRQASLTSLNVFSDIASSRAAGGFRALTPALGLASIAVEVGSLAFASWAKNAADAKARTEAFEGTLDGLGNTTDDTIRQINENVLDLSFKRGWDEVGRESSIMVSDWAQTIGLDVSDLTKAIIDQDGAWLKVQEAAETYKASLGGPGSDMEADNDERNRANSMIELIKQQRESLTDAEVAKLKAIELDKAMGVSAEDAAVSTAVLTEAQLAEQQATEAATQALEDWKTAAGDSDASFIDLQGGYDGVIEKSMAWAQSQADSTQTADDSWQTYYDGVSVSMEEYLVALEEQVAAQQGWETNMLLLSGRVSQGVIDELTRLGPEGAPLVADLVNASDEELARLEEVYGQRSATATGAFANNLLVAGPVLAEVMRVAGADAAGAAAAALAAGETTLSGVVSQYDLDIDLDATTVAAERKVNGFADEQAQRTVYLNFAVNNPFYMKAVANGAVMDYFANGGMSENHVAEIAPAGAWRVWAEPETGGEAYIPLAPSKRARSLNIWRETGRRLGQDVQQLALGGLRTAPHAPHLQPTVLAPAPTNGAVVQVTTPATVVESAVLSGAFTVGDDGLLRLVDGRIRIAQSAQSVSIGRGY